MLKYSAANKKTYLNLQQLLTFLQQGIQRRFDKETLPNKGKGTKRPFPFYPSRNEIALGKLTS